MKKFIESYLSNVDKTTLDASKLQDFILSTAAHIKFYNPESDIEFVTGSGYTFFPYIGIKYYDLCTVAETRKKTSEELFIFSPCFLGPLPELPRISQAQMYDLSVNLVKSQAFNRLSIVDGWRFAPICVREYQAAVEQNLEISEIYIV